MWTKVLVISQKTEYYWNLQTSSFVLNSQNVKKKKQSQSWIKIDLNQNKVRKIIHKVCWSIVEWSSVLWVCGSFLWLKTQFEEGITASLRKVSFKYNSGIITLLLSIKTSVQKTSANMKLYQYILLHIKIVFGNLADPFYSLSFRDAYLNIKSALNFGGTQYKRYLSPLNKWQLSQSKWLCITI